MLVDVLLDVLLVVLLVVLPDVLLGVTKFDVEATPPLLLLEDSEVLDGELITTLLATPLTAPLTMLLVMLVEIADVVKALEVKLGLGLVAVFDTAFDVALEDTLGVGTLDTVVGLVTETVARACE